jgi:hypothetical protein
MRRPLFSALRLLLISFMCRDRNRRRITKKTGTTGKPEDRKAGVTGKPERPERREIPYVPGTTEINSAPTYWRNNALGANRRCRPILLCLYCSLRIIFPGFFLLFCAFCLLGVGIRVAGAPRMQVGSLRGMRNAACSNTRKCIELKT